MASSGCMDTSVDESPVHHSAWGKHAHQVQGSEHAWPARQAARQRPKSCLLGAESNTAGAEHTSALRMEFLKGWDTGLPAVSPPPLLSSPEQRVSWV